MKQNHALWATKTCAEVFTPSTWRAYSKERAFYVVGWMGFAGSWKRSGLKGAALETYIREMYDSIDPILLDYKSTYGAKLVIASGATDLGVLQVVYALCARHGILAMGIAPDGVLRYPLGEMNFVVPYGKQFGEESALFVELCASFVLVGGGPQSEYETRSALKRGKPVTIVHGFGGVADSVDWDDLKWSPDLMIHTDRVTGPTS